MSIKLQGMETSRKSGILNDPGNMLIICYVAVILFFLLIGGIGAAKYSSNNSASPSTVSNEIHKTFFQLI